MATQNHIRLIKALASLKKRKIAIDLVLTGSRDADFSTFNKVSELSRKIGIDNQIKYLGYVDNYTLSLLYKGALALVMPTFFGPSNIPVLEAWVIGTPVIYSGVYGCREQLGNAGMLVNPRSVKDIADKIETIYNDRSLRVDLIKKGKLRSRKWSVEKYNEELRELIASYRKFRC